MTPDTGPRSTITDHQPDRPGNGSARTWSRVLRGVPHRFTAVTMPDGERRYFADRYNGYGDDGTDRGRESGMRFGCAWSRVASWIIPPAAAATAPATEQMTAARAALDMLVAEAGGQPPTSAELDAIPDAPAVVDSALARAAQLEEVENEVSELRERARRVDAALAPFEYTRPTREDLDRIRAILNGAPGPAVDASPALAQLEQLRSDLVALETEARGRHASEVTFARVELRGVVTDHSDTPSPCCGAGEHRPGGGPWFCRDCGNTRPDTPPARQRHGARRREAQG